MICPACGKTIPDDSVNCPECGAAVNNPLNDSDPVVVGTPAPVEGSAAGMKFADFLKLPENKKLKSTITSSSVILYICGALSGLLAIAAPEMGASIIDAILLIGLGIWLHVTKSKVPAIVTLIYGIINVIYIVATTHKLGGYLILLAGIYAVLGTFKARKAYKDAGGTK